MGKLLRFGTWRDPSLFSSSAADEAERLFLGMLGNLQSKGQLDEVSFRYFSRPLRDRPGLLVTLNYVRSRFSKARIVDLGCGMGQFEAEICKSKGYNCVGLDANKAFVRMALLRAKLHGYSNASFILGDIHSLPVKTGLFNAAILHDVVFGINIKSLVQEVARVLEKEGALIFDAPLALFYLVFPFKRPFLKYSELQIANCLIEKGFIRERVFLPGFPPVLNEDFHLPAMFMRTLSKVLMLFPQSLQGLVGRFWFNLVFTWRYNG
jgi:SAM-dependent methyltransferase